ncbi:MAG: nuclear transport factor 2 family protein [Phycisphaerales bacterium]|nr:nuclear transport factor 2 family protein [Phycisphaerales bacterium]
MQTNANAQRDLNTLTALNRDFVASVQKGDVKRFQEILADDFMCSIPDGSLLDKAEFLKLTAQPGDDQRACGRERANPLAG